MQPAQLPRLTALALMSLSLFLSLFISGAFLQSASSALAATHQPSSLSHSQPFSTTRPTGKSPVQGGGLICANKTGGVYVWSSAAVATVTLNGVPTSVVYIGSSNKSMYELTT